MFQSAKDLLISNKCNYDVIIISLINLPLSYIKLFEDLIRKGHIFLFILK